jgi:hypothetical protein
LAILIVAVLLGACGSPALDYARARNVGCEVRPLEQRGNWVRVEVACPDAAPVERTYGR